MSMKLIAILLAGLLMVPAMGAMAEGEADIVDTAVAAGTFTTLIAAVQAADLVDTLNGKALLPYLLQPMRHSQHCLQL